MSTLVPERRANKNGVVVTRWVKPSQGEATLKALPAPNAPVSTANAEKVLNSFIANYDLDYPPYSDNMRFSVSRMGEYAEEFTDDVELLFGASDLFISLSEVADRIYGDGSEVPEETRNIVMKNYVSLVSQYSEEDEKEDYGVYAAYFAAMTFHSIDGYNSTREYTEDQKIGYRAATRYAETLFPRPNDENLADRGFVNTGDRILFSDRDSIDALAEHPLLADIIVDELIKRKMLSGEIVRSIARSGTLSRGVL